MQRRVQLFVLMTACLLMTSIVSGAAPLQPQAEPPAISAEARTFSGTVQPLFKVLQERQVPVDQDAASSVMAIVDDNGKVFTIVKNQGSRALYFDEELHARPVQLVAVQIPGTQMLQVERIRTVVDGQLMEVDYWCAICALRYAEPGICICCGAQAARRELPVEEAADGKSQTTADSKEAK